MRVLSSHDTALILAESQIDRYAVIKLRIRSDFDPVGPVQDAKMSKRWGALRVLAKILVRQVSVKV